MLHPAIVVKEKSSIDGSGLFCTEPIAKGVLIWQLTEPTYSLNEVLSWQGKQRDHFNHYGFQCGTDRFSSPQDMSREMNHSCDPNTWWQGDDCLVARFDIFPGDEITYDYATSEVDLDLDLSCRCGAYNCRKQISNRDYLRLDWQKQYGDHLPSHVLKAIAATNGSHHR